MENIMKQLSLDVDTFQPNEVRELIAEVRYRHTVHEPRYSGEEANDCYFNPTVARTEATMREYHLGLVLTTDAMRDIRENVKKIEDGVSAFARNEYKHLEDFVILMIDIKAKNKAVFSLDYLLNIKY